MGQEIERKFLVDAALFKPASSGTEYVQGYIAQGGLTVRVRIAGDAAYLTLKSPVKGISRKEYEYPIPVRDAAEMLALFALSPCVRKTRYVEMFGGKRWEVDVFAGDNAGLIMAEIELTDENEPFEKPPFVTQEVSHDSRYFNSNLAKNPFRTWKTHN